MYHTTDAYCSYITWAKPHLLLFVDDYRVFTLDPTTRKLRDVASLSEFLASRKTAWVAGHGPGDPEVDPVSTTVYVLSIHDGSCRVVPGRSEDIQGFTSDNKNVIVLRGYQKGQPQYSQFAISSLPSDCPLEVLPPKK